MTDIRFRSDMTVELVASNASDSSVTYAARVSTLGEQVRENEGQDLTSRDEGLIRYLIANRHGSPYEHNMMTFFISAPIFVFREFHRHRIGWSYNESSGRYRELEPVFYIPAEDRPLVQTGKPGYYEFISGTREQTHFAQDTISVACAVAYQAYEDMLAAGVAKEVARTVLPVGTYSSMYATCNARSLMAFLSLRTHEENSHFPSYPQREIEMVARGMEEHFAELMPLTYKAFNANGRVSP